MIDLYSIFFVLFAYLIVVLPSIMLIVITKFLKKVNEDIFNSLAGVFIFLYVTIIPFYFLYAHFDNKCFGYIAGFAVGNMSFILGYMLIIDLLDLIKKKWWLNWLKK